MENERAEPAAALRSPADWFDTESAAVVTILLGVFQVILAACFVDVTQSPPKLFIFVLLLGILIIAGGVLTLANEKNPRKILVQGCACSNVLGLLLALLGFGLYCYSITHLEAEGACFGVSDHYYYYDHTTISCPADRLKAYSWSLTLLLIIYDVGAVIMQCLLSVIAIRTLKTVS
ncbi:unnamed protein product [Ophioblennius macclurei]